MKRAFEDGGLKAVLAVAVAVSLAVLAGCETGKSMTRSRIKAVEKGLTRAVYLKGTRSEKLQLEARMLFYRVPGVSIAVLDHNRTEWVKAYGTADSVRGEPLTERTLFQAGAVSRVPAVAAALRLAAEGRLDFDGRVNGMLKGWKFPDERRNGPVEEPTLRGLLLNRPGFPAGSLPESPVSEAAPSLVDVLNGREAAAAALMLPDPGRARPGDQSDAVYAVLQKIIEDATGGPYAAAAERMVLKPLGMAGSVFDSQIVGREAGLASGHDRTGKPIEGRRMVHPSDAASGLWSTPAELAGMVVDLLECAMDKGGKLLPPEQARLMLATQAGGQGLGFSVDGSGMDIRVSARGRTSGFTCAVEIYPYKGQGAVIMTNSDNGAILTDEILGSISAAYGWPDFKPQEKSVYRLDPSIYRQYVGRYEVSRDYALDVANEDYYLVIRPTGQSATRFYAENQSFFYSVDPFIRIQFLFDKDSNVTGLVLWQEDFKLEARKVS